MASKDGKGSAGKPDGGASAQWGARRGRTKAVVDGEALASLLAGRDRLQEATEQYVIASTREIMHLRAVNDRLERRVASLQQQVGNPAADKEEKSSPPEGNAKPL